MVRLPDNVAAGNVTTWTAVLTCTLGVLEIPDNYTGWSYILDVLEVDAMHCVPAPLDRLLSPLV
jgi:hypothetical protein